MKNKIFKISFVLVLVSLGFSLNSRKAEAHFLLIDHNIGAILHIDPSDDPTSKIPSVFHYDFKDIGNKLDLNLCDCTFLIINNGSPIYSGKLGVDKNIQFTSNTAQFSYTLPSKGVYTLIVEGKSAASNFPSFKLSSDLRVDKEGIAASGSAAIDPVLFHGIHYGLFGGAILISIYIVVRDRKKERKAKMEIQKDKRT